MPDPLPDVWTTRDFPILVETCRAIDAGNGISSQQIADALDIPPLSAVRGLQALKRRGYVACEWMMSGDAHVTEVSGEAYQIVGLHPSGNDAVELLLDALTRAAANTSDPSDKSLLRDAKRSLSNISGNVVSGVMTAVLTASAGL